MVSGETQQEEHESAGQVSLSLSLFFNQGLKPRDVVYCVVQVRMSLLCAVELSGKVCPCGIFQVTLNFFRITLDINHHGYFLSTSTCLTPVVYVCVCLCIIEPVSTNILDVDSGTETCLDSSPIFYFLQKFVFLKRDSLYILLPVYGGKELKVNEKKFME